MSSRLCPPRASPSRHEGHTFVNGSCAGIVRKREIPANSDAGHFVSEGGQANEKYSITNEKPRELEPLMIRLGRALKMARKTFTNVHPGS